MHGEDPLYARDEGGELVREKEVNGMHKTRNERRERLKETAAVAGLIAFAVVVFFCGMAFMRAALLA